MIHLEELIKSHLNAIKEINLSNYEKKSITITGSDYKKFISIKNKNEFVKYFRNYNINFLSNVNKKNNCIIVNYLKKKKKKKSNIK
jgi:predicted nucleic-acid-binding Zn-ribbon protein